MCVCSVHHLHTSLSLSLSLSLYIYIYIYIYIYNYIYTSGESVSVLSVSLMLIVARGHLETFLPPVSRVAGYNLYSPSFSLSSSLSLPLSFSLSLSLFSSLSLSLSLSFFPSPSLSLSHSLSPLFLHSACVSSLFHQSIDIGQQLHSKTIQYHNLVWNLIPVTYFSPLLHIHCIYNIFTSSPHSETLSHVMGSNFETITPATISLVGLLKRPQIPV